MFRRLLLAGGPPGAERKAGHLRSFPAPAGGPVQGRGLGSLGEASTILVESCPADLDDSGSVDAADLSRVLSGFSLYDAEVDFNNDGMVTPSDLSFLLGQRGVCGGS